MNQPTPPGLRVAVLGAGSWGTALAAAASRRQPTVLWARDPAQAAEARLFADFLGSSASVFERSHPPGHFTGSAWLVSADGERVLLTHHRKLGRWLQLGGHADGAIGAKSMHVDRLSLEMRIPSVRLLDGSSGGGSVAAMRCAALQARTFASPVTKAAKVNEGSSPIEAPP